MDMDGPPELAGADPGDGPERRTLGRLAEVFCRCLYKIWAVGNCSRIQSQPDEPMSNASYICFECRQAVRRSTPEKAIVKCPSCGQRCQYLGRKIPVPPKSKLAAWRDLRTSMATIRTNWGVRQEREAVRRRHDVEKRITELELRQPNPSRDRLLTELRGRLGGG